VKEIDPSMFTKSGLMVGLGEYAREILQVNGRSARRRGRFPHGGSIFSRRPSTRRSTGSGRPPSSTSSPRMARAKGFLNGLGLAASTRSSYHAGDDFARLRTARANQRKT